MKPKKMLTLLLCLLGTVYTSYAQKGTFTASFDIGYGFRAAPVTNLSQTDNYTYKNVTYSLGQGLNAVLGGAYMIGDHVGAGLDIGYLSGKKVEFDEVSNNYTRKSYWKGSMLSFTPNIVISANAEKLNPYCRFGIVIASPNIDWQGTESGSGSRSGTAIFKIYGNIAMGWYGAVGVQYPVSDKLMINAELFNRSMTYKPKTVENTQAFDGEKKQETITLVKTINSSSGSNTDNQIYFPFSSTGIMIGVSMRLAGGNK